MAVLTPNAGLGCAAVVFGFFSLATIAFPVAFLAQYNLDLGAVHTNVTDATTNVTSTTPITEAEKLIISTSLQNLGVTLGIAVAINTITFRGGTDDQKSTVCLMNGLSSLLSSIIGVCTPSYWDGLVSSTGIYINAGLFFLVAIVNFLGGCPPAAFKLANVSKPLYWGFLGISAIYVFYMFAMVFATDALFESYGVKISGNPQKVLVGLFKFSMAPTFLQIALLLIAQIIAPGPLATYSIARYMAMISLGSFLMSAVSSAVWTCLNDADGKYDKIIRGQNFNMFLWAVFWVAFYVPVALMDPVLKDTVDNEIGTAPAKKAKKKKGAEPSAEPAAEPVTDEVVQPLLPPLMPLASAQQLVPSYSMVQQPQMTYASYAAPATYATAPMAYAPSTTAYAAPATYSAGFAAPAFGTTTYTTGGVV